MGDGTVPNGARRRRGASLGFDPLAVEARDQTHLGAAQLDRALRDDVEDRLKIGRRAADHLEDLARRRLLLQRLAEVVVARSQLREQAHVLDGDHRLVREGLEEGDLASGEGTDLRVPHRNGADRTVIPEHRDREHAAEANLSREILPGKFRVPLNVGNMDHGPIQDSAAGEDLAMGPSGKELARPFQGQRGIVELCPHIDELAVKQVHGREEGAAESGGVLGHRVEHGLDVGGRARDHPENFRGGRLLLQRLGQIVVAGTQLGEETHVLDGDYRLVGEALEERDLTVREGLRLEPPELDDAGRLALAQQGNAQHRPKATLLGKGTGHGKLRRFGQKIDNVYGPPLKHTAPGDAAAHHRDQDGGSREWAMVGGPAKVIAFSRENGRVVGSAESGGVLDHSVQDGLNFRGRAADHAQDLPRRRLLLQRFAQPGVARLELPGQPRVLERDRRLVGEGLEEGDLVSGEGTDGGAQDHEGAHGPPALDQRSGEHCAQPGRPLEARGVPVLALRGHLQVAHVNGPPIDHRTTGHGSPAEGKRLAERERPGQPSMLGRDGETGPVDEVEGPWRGGRFIRDFEAWGEWAEISPRAGTGQEDVASAMLLRKFRGRPWPWSFRPSRRHSSASSAPWWRSPHP